MARLIVKSVNIALILLFTLTGTAFGNGEGCAVTTVAVNFGEYDCFSSAPLDGIGQIKVSTPPRAGYAVKLETGKGSGDIRVRKMSSQEDSIFYNLYIDPARIFIWGDGTCGTRFPSGSGQQTFTVYGRVPPRQNVGAGTYEDTVTVTIEW